MNKQGEAVRCYSCNGNHYANDKNCPMRSDRVTRSAVASARASGNSPSPSSTRPQLATPSGALPIGSPSGPAPIRNNAVTVPSSVVASSAGVSVPPAVVIASASLPSVHSNGPLTATAVIPTQHTVYLMVNGRVYSSLTDSGAERSFVDSALVSSLSAPITPPVPGSKIRLAHADIFTDRSGSVNLDATALFLGCDRDAVSFRCQFEIMPIHGVGNDHHFIIGRDLIRVLFPHGIPLSYLPQETSDSSVVTVVASSTLVDPLAVSSDASMLGSMPTDDQPDRIQLSTPEQLEAQYAAPRQHLLQTLSPLLATNAAVTGFCNVPEAIVRLEVDPADATRLWRTQYPIAETLRAAATVIINRWFSEGKIVLAPPGCPYNNPITVAPKKDEHGMLTGARPCLDVRALNQVLKPWGIVYCLRRFHAYIWGRTDLVLHTDHKPLTHMFSSAELSHPLQQWLDTILDYQFVIVHRDGILNVIPDVIARRRRRRIDTDKPVFQVQRILEHRGSPGSYTYLVHWKGLDQPTDHTWEPAASFLDHHVIESYWRSKRQ